VKFLVVEIQVQLKASPRTDFVLLLLYGNFFMFLLQMLYDSAAQAKDLNVHTNYIKGRNLKSQ
jgi:hypothetical protein